MGYRLFPEGGRAYRLPPLPARRGQLEKLRAQRLFEALHDRAFWAGYTRQKRAVRLRLRATLWRYHPAATAVERSAVSRAARRKGRLP